MIEANNFLILMVVFLWTRHRLARLVISESELKPSLTPLTKVFTYSTKNWASMEPVNYENPTFEMHDDIRNGQIDDQLVSGRSNVLISEIYNLSSTLL
jgi:hypothetical protein